MPFEQDALVPVSFVVRVPNVLMVNPDRVKARTLPDFLAELKANRGKYSYGSPGNGSTGHLSTELFKTLAGVDVAHVPYRGSAPMLLDLVSGSIQMAIDNLPSAMAHIRSGKVIALGVTSTNKVASLPDVPPIASAVPGYEAESWFVLMAPRGTPENVIRQVAAMVDGILEEQDVKERLATLGAQPVGGTPEELASSSPPRPPSGRRWSRARARRSTERSAPPRPPAPRRSSSPRRRAPDYWRAGLPLPAGGTAPSDGALPGDSSVPVSCSIHRTISLTLAPAPAARSAAR